jgi:hypothetical protein
MMTKETSQIPEMSLEELFASARAAGNSPQLITLTVQFQLIGCDADCGTLTVSRNPNATRWLTTVGIVHGEQYQARMAQGRTISEALDKIERYCHWWLGM